jgi:hypothetical protein
MIVFDHGHYESYLRYDPVLKFLEEMARNNDASFTSHRWLLESAPKRMIYFYIYGDLLQPTTQPKKVLDVGGGYTSLSRRILRNHHYTLLDIMAHDSHENLRKVEASLGKSFWVNSDWYQFNPTDGYDFVVANDLFPNVDQRLELFLKKFLPICQEMRLALTYYNTPRFYHVKRLDADEVLCLLAWDGRQVGQILEKYIDRIEAPNLEILFQDPPSLFANKRQICMVSLRNSRRTAFASSLQNV